MQSQLYVGLAAQLSLARRLDTIANNVANQNTAGYRAEEISFAELVSNASQTPVSFVSRGESYISTRPGEVSHTGNPLDVAVKGDVWLAVATPAGTAYTRDGRLQMSPTGELTTVTGFKILDAGGAPLQIDPASAAPVIASDGTITQGGRSAGALGVFRMQPGTKLQRFDNSSVVPDRTPVAELDFNAAGVQQGFMERSNVDPMKEVSKLIAIQRTFDSVATTMSDVENSMRDSMRVLAGG